MIITVKNKVKIGSAQTLGNKVGQCACHFEWVCLCNVFDLFLKGRYNASTNGATFEIPLYERNKDLFISLWTDNDIMGVFQFIAH